MTSASRIFMAPARYIQGPGVMRRLPEVIREHGNSPVLIIDAGIAVTFMSEFSEVAGTLKTQGRVFEFAGEVTLQRISSLAAQAAALAPDVVIGVGGGKALDAAKGVALRLDAAFISVPTIASTDAPASRGLVLYNEDRGWGAVEQLPLNPVCVLVDTRWIVCAPRRFLVAGIGDAISKKFEVRACYLGGGLNKNGTRASMTALVMANACYDTLMMHAVGAMDSFETGACSESLEATVEACLLMSALAFENGGLSIAHAVTAAFPSTRGLEDRLHGEHVAYGTLVQLALEGHEATPCFDDLRRFYRRIGLPATLSALGMINPLPHEIRSLASSCVNVVTRKGDSVMFSEAVIVDAIERIEAMSPAT